MEDFLLDAQQSASTLGEENKRLLDARRREQERWEEERAQSKHIVQEMETEVGREGWELGLFEDTKLDLIQDEGSTKASPWIDVVAEVLFSIDSLL